MGSNADTRPGPAVGELLDMLSGLPDGTLAGHLPVQPRVLFLSDAGRFLGAVTRFGPDACSAFRFGGHWPVRSLVEGSVLLVVIDRWLGRSGILGELERRYPATDGRAGRTGVCHPSDHSFLDESCPACRAKGMLLALHMPDPGVVPLPANEHWRIPGPSWCPPTGKTPWSVPAGAAVS